MRILYPVSSNELNDALLEAYAKYVHLLGYDNEYGETTYSGVYDINENSIKDLHQYTVLNNNGAPSNNISTNSITKYIDSVAYSVSLGRAGSAPKVVDQPYAIGTAIAPTVKPGSIGTATNPTVKPGSIGIANRPFITVPGGIGTANG